MNAVHTNGQILGAHDAMNNAMNNVMTNAMPNAMPNAIPNAAQNGTPAVSENSSNEDLSPLEAGK